MCVKAQNNLKVDTSKIAEYAFKLNDELYAKYPFTTMNNYKPSTYGTKPTREGENCACGVPRMLKEGDKNGKKWRGMFCKNRKCDPIWLPNQREESKAKNEDSILEEANQQEDDREFGVEN